MFYNIADHNNTSDSSGDPQTPEHTDKVTTETDGNYGSDQNV